MRTILLGLTLCLGSLVQGAIYTNQVAGNFRAKVEQVASRLSIDPDHLVATMALETAKPENPGRGTPTFDPAIQNSKTKAVGLIQFTPKTANALGITVDALVKLSAVEQLDWVEEYFKDFKDKMKTLTDVYLAVCFPAAIGKPEDYLLPDWAYSGNEGLDINGDGKISRAEIGAKVKRYFDKGVGK